MTALSLGTIAVAHYTAGRYAEASRYTQQAAQLRPGFQGAHRLHCASLAQAGRLDEGANRARHDPRPTTPVVGCVDQSQRALPNARVDGAFPGGHAQSGSQRPLTGSATDAAMVLAAGASLPPRENTQTAKQAAARHIGARRQRKAPGTRAVGPSKPEGQHLVLRRKITTTRRQHKER